MKKTLVTLAALAAAFSGVAAAEDYTFSVPSIGTETNGVMGNPFAAGDYTFDFSLADEMTVGEKYAIAGYYGTEPANTWGYGANGYNITRNADKTYTLTVGDAWCDLNSTTRAFTVIGDAGRYASTTLTLAADTVYTVSVDGALDKQVVTILNGTTTLATLTYNGNMDGYTTKMGTYFNQDFAPVAVTPDTPAVPEPTTATLSLLALAGLAARRRRK